MVRRKIQIHSMLVARCKITRYSLQNSLVTHCKNSLATRCKNSLATRCKIRSLLVAEIARCKKPLATHCKIRSLLVAEIARCKNSLVARRKIRSLLIAEVARCKNSLIVKSRSLFVAKFNRYLLHKFTKKSKLNLVMGDKI